MNIRSEQHGIRETGKFSALILDYLDDHPALQSLHNGLPSFDAVHQAIDRRRAFPINRERLVRTLKSQYASVDQNPTAQKQIESLQRESTFTITTAHQCNIFLGPLYTIYKTLHTIRIADALNAQFPEQHFVPVFYLGSEDADLDELNHIHLFDQKLVWHPSQKGAVGRMKVDEELIRLIDRQAQLLSSSNNGKEWIELLRQSYMVGSSLSMATFRLLHTLFADRGLLVLEPDQADLKSTMKDIFWEELQSGSSAARVADLNAQLQSLGYTAQAHARPINLFYLTEGSRARIERVNDEWLVKDENIRWNSNQLKQALETHPERFSPNVILRGLYQECILPNLLYVGGGGELAYWLQLKTVFDSRKVPFPLLQLRASLQWMDLAAADRMQALQLNPADLFATVNQLLDANIPAEAKSSIELQQQIDLIFDAYQQLQQKAISVDPTLGPHVESLRVRAIKKVEELSKKMTRAERKKMSDHRSQIETLQRTLFPNGILQERWDNIGYYYALHGKDCMETIYQQISPFGKGFTWIIERK